MKHNPLSILWTADVGKFLLRCASCCHKFEHVANYDKVRCPACGTWAFVDRELGGDRTDTILECLEVMERS